MSDQFIVTPKNSAQKEEKSVIMTLRVDRTLQQEFDALAQKSDRSRNELMCMALRYALAHLKFLENGEAEH